MRLVVTRRASRRLKAIRASIEADDPLAADRVEDRVFALLDHLLENPRMGPAWDATTRSVVVTPYPYRVHYRIDGDAVTLITINHTAQRPPRL